MLTTIERFDSRRPHGQLKNHARAISDAIQSLIRRLRAWRVATYVTLKGVPHFVLPSPLITTSSRASGILPDAFILTDNGNTSNPHSTRHTPASLHFNRGHRRSIAVNTMSPSGLTDTSSAIKADYLHDTIGQNEQSSPVRRLSSPSKRCSRMTIIPEELSESVTYEVRVATDHMRTADGGGPLVKKRGGMTALNPIVEECCEDNDEEDKNQEVETDAYDHDAWRPEENLLPPRAGGSVLPLPNEALLSSDLPTILTTTRREVATLKTLPYKKELLLRMVEATHMQDDEGSHTQFRTHQRQLNKKAQYTTGIRRAFLEKELGKSHANIAMLELMLAVRDVSYMDPLMMARSNHLGLQTPPASGHSSPKRSASQPSLHELGAHMYMP